jgi:DNA-binding response OmpR family regulator
MDSRPHIVVVEDEVVQRQMLADYLARQNFRVSPLGDGAALRRLIERELPALVMLDVGLPGEDGFTLARWLRERSGRVGIIMVTAASDTVDRVVGLETGADDYIAKPFEPRELLARVKSVLRRATGMPTEGPRVRVGRRVLDLDRRVLIDPGDGTEERLAASEFDLLKIFAENPNRPLTRDWLLEGHGAPRGGCVRSRDRPAHYSTAAQGRDRSRPSRRDPDGARGRLHVRPAKRLIYSRDEHPPNTPVLRNLSR